jgi:cell division septation protein DedD
VPNRGVTLVYPASPRQRQMALAGSNWLNVSWRSARGIIDDDDRGMRGRRRRSLEHHVYVLASERPLRLTDNAFDDDALAAMLGARLTQAADPYETMAALSRRFVPRGNDEDWGEDVYTMDVSRPVITVRVAKIYCPDGSVVYTRDEMADRTACPWRPQGRNTPAPRPDSVVASNGRRVPSPMDPGGVARIFRIPTPVEAPDTHPVNGGDVANGRPNGNGNGNANGNGGRDANDESGRGRDNPKGNNGNHYGWGNGNGNEGKDKPTGAGGKDNNGNNGSNVANGNSGNANDGKDKSNNGNHYGQEKGNNGNGSNGNGSNNGNNGNGQAEIQQQGKPERPSQAQPSEPKPAETKPAETKPAETKPAEVKPDAKPAAEPAAKNEPAPKQEEKPAAKQENKGMRGLMDRLRANADSSDAKDKDRKGKPDRN